MTFVMAWDTETSSLPDKTLPLDHPRQPHIVQLACLLADDATGDEVSIFSAIVNPDGLESIDKAAQDAHGLPLDHVRAAGIPLATALSVWSNMRGKAAVEVGHNIAFDEQMIAIATARLKRQITTKAPAKRVCTMELCRPLMRMPATAKSVAAGFGAQFKPPKLVEAHQFFFGEDFPAHDALADARASLRLYFQLKDELRVKHNMMPVKGELEGCAICGGAEAALPIDCPGLYMSADELDSVQAGSQDFIRGRWYERPWVKMPDSVAG